MFRFVFYLGLIFLLGCKAVVAEETRSSVTTPALTSELFIRIIKTTPDHDKGVLEMWKRDADGVFHLDRSFPTCTWSGELGPKLKEGDGQSPEGFYFVTPGALNPNSSYHLSFNLGYPNAYDRARGRTGSYLMVHGECVSIGCYAMTNDGIEAIYADVEAAFAGGQPFVRAHIFPFPMTEENLAAHKDNPNADFWANLKAGWDWFEREGVPPNVTVEGGLYQFADDSSD